MSLAQRCAAQTDEYGRHDNSANGDPAGAHLHYPSASAANAAPRHARITRMG